MTHLMARRNITCPLYPVGLGTFEFGGVSENIYKIVIIVDVFFKPIHMFPKVLKLAQHLETHIVTILTFLKALKKQGRRKCHSSRSGSKARPSIRN